VQYRHDGLQRNATSLNFTSGEWRIEMLRYLLPACLAFASTASAEIPYLDDRSTPSMLIESLYNAISRKEFARAWDYFSEKPSASFETFVKGYEKTESVGVMTGAVTSDGAAGSTFYSVPVGLRAQENGEEKWFSGCYTVRQVNGTVQEPPFKPLMIEAAKLKKSNATSTSDAVPSTCGDTAAPALKDDILARAKSNLQSELARLCTLDFAGENRLDQAEAFEIKYRYSYQTADEPDNTSILIRFPCDSGAYNTIELYYLWQKDAGFEPVNFASPDLDYAYLDDNSEKLKSVTLRGFVAQSRLVNSEFDPKTNSIGMYSKWRGIGDASSNGTWVFRDGSLVLDVYGVDPTYDGEMEGIEVIKAGKVVLDEKER
jgi:hypothetical protein